MSATSRGDAEVVSQASRHLFGRGLLYVAVWSLGLVAGVFVTPFITRILGVTGFGRLAAALAVGQVLVVLVGLGMQAAIIRQYVDDDGDRRARGLLFVALALALLLTAIIEVSGPMWCHSLGFPTFGGALRVVVLWVFPASACQAAMGLLRAQDRLGAFSSISIMQSVGAQGCGIALLIWMGRSASHYTEGLLLGQVAAFAVAMVLTRPHAAGISDTVTVRAALALGLPLVPQGLAVFVLSMGDRLIIQRLLGPTAVGRYQVGYGVGSLILLLMASLNQSWEAGVLGIRDEGLRSRVIFDARERLLRILQPVLIGMVVGAPVVLHIFAPASFRPDGLVVITAVVALSAVPYAFYMSNVLRLLSVRRTRSLAFVSVVCAGGNILLNFLLIPVLGITGSAVATVLAFTMQAVMTHLAARRFLDLPRTPLRTWAVLTTGVVVALATVLAPKAGTWTELRIALGVLCVGWFLVMLRKPTLERGRRAGSIASTGEWHSRFLAQDVVVARQVADRVLSDRSRTS